MTCKYCGCPLANASAKICKSTGCKNHAKRDRAHARRNGDPSSEYIPRPGSDDVSADPPELAYLDDGPLLSLDQLLVLKHDPGLHRKAKESRRLRQRKLAQRIREVGVYDIFNADV